jgi:hypothetical protein
MLEYSGKMNLLYVCTFKMKSQAALISAGIYLLIRLYLNEACESFPFNEPKSYKKWFQSPPEKAQLLNICQIFCRVIFRKWSHNSN